MGLPAEIDSSQPGAGTSAAVGNERWAGAPPSPIGFHAIAGGVANVINNLLTSVIGHIELAEMQLPDGTVGRRDLETALRDAERLTEVTKRTLTHFGVGVVDFNRLDLRSIAERAAVRLSEHIPGTVDLNLNLGSWPVAVLGDADALERMLWELLNNALEAMGEDRGNIGVSVMITRVDEEFFADHAMPCCLKPGEYACVEISDDGYGMDPDTAGKIFDPFYSTKGAGRGLGLPEAYGMVLLHGGAIAVNSEIGKGSTFKALLPTADRKAEEGPDEENPQAAPWTSCAILVVDDESGIRRYAKRVLGAMGYAVLVADNGRSAVDAFRENADSIELVLLDVFMPGMNGDEVLRELRRIRPGVKVVVMTGYTESMDLDGFKGRPPLAFMHKPFSKGEFVAKITKAINS